jgi:hypothetical protein
MTLPQMPTAAWHTNVRRCKPVIQTLPHTVSLPCHIGRRRYDIGLQCCGVQCLYKMHDVLTCLTYV